MNHPTVAHTTATREAERMARSAVLAPSARPVVVGVDGLRGELSEGTAAAVRWAADEAVSRRVDLHVVCVFEWVALPPRWTKADDVVTSELRHEADRSVTAAITLARHVIGARGDVEVTGSVLRGDTHRVLEAIGHEAGELVVGTRRLGWTGRTVLGSVSMLISSSAPCPVIVTCGTGLESGSIVVGVDPDGSSQAAVEFAAARASRLGRPMHAVLAANRVIADVRILREDAQRWLDEALCSVRAEYPDVEIRAEVHLDHAVDTLLRASHDQHMLVVGRRETRQHPGLHIGSVGRRVLHLADCPVAVVPC